MTATGASPCALCALCAAALLFAGCDSVQTADVAERRAAATIPPMIQFAPAPASPPIRSNARMAQDFLDLSFEMESGRAIPHLSRFEGPITVAVAPGAPATLAGDLDRLLSRLRNEARVDIARAAPGALHASITIETLPRARMQRIVPQAACFVVPRVASWSEFRAARRGRTLDWTTLETRERVAVFIPSDVSPQEIRDCLHEEIAQAIGPLNDLYRLPDSVFNDDNMHAVLTGFDMLMLRAYYHPALRSGMDRAAVAERLPAILRDLNPRGETGADVAALRTPRPWIEAVETALGAGESVAARRAAAVRTVEIARDAGFEDSRLAFSYFVFGRLSIATDVDASVTALRSAASIYDRIAPGGVQTAHLHMQLAAFALHADQPETALRLTGSAMRGAADGQNAALLSTVLMIRAAALDALQRPSEARETRLDSLAWGRYGFGGNAAVGARLTEVAALSPQDQR